jgi:uncharacterized metal-binding protein YceD (DUF177 family)
VNQVSSSYLSRRVLKLNVGYLLDGNNQSSKDMTLDLPRVQVADDLNAEYIRGPLRVSRTKEGLLVQGQLEVGMEGQCYRCLVDVERPIVVDVEELYARHGDLSEDEAEFQVHEDGQLDLAPLLRAEVLIQTTRGLRCEDTDACTERMQDLEDNAGIDHLDPRMAVLKELLDSEDS